MVDAVGDAVARTVRRRRHASIGAPGKAGQFLTSARLDMKVWNWGRDSRALISELALIWSAITGLASMASRSRTTVRLQVIPGHAVAVRRGELRGQHRSG